MPDASQPDERSNAPRSKEPSRSADAGASPTWIWIVLSGVMLFSVFSLDIGSFSPGSWLPSSDTAAKTTAEAKPVSGGTIYSSRCANCHQANGEGVANAFPPLNQTRWVENKGQIIRILLHGMQGPVEVRGTTYNGNMPAWRSMLNDEEVAAVISFVRQNWENDFPAVTAEEVAAVRAATEGHIQPWTAQELDLDENRTVPGVDGKTKEDSERPLGQAE